MLMCACVCVCVSVCVCERVCACVRVCVKGQDVRASRGNFFHVFFQFSGRGWWKGATSPHLKRVTSARCIYCTCVIYYVLIFVHACEVYTVVSGETVKIGWLKEDCVCVCGCERKSCVHVCVVVVGVGFYLEKVLHLDRARACHQYEWMTVSCSRMQHVSMQV